MDHLTIIRQLAHNAETIRGSVAGVGEEQARWRPTADDWSILEVINHLYDEEREDFRQRLEYVLHWPDDQPSEMPPPIDPQGWVMARGYNQRDLAASVQNWLGERQQSLAWLNGLAAPNWERSYRHPAGSLRAGDLLAAWLAHDFLHLRQIVELHYAWAKHISEPYQLEYAGDW